MEEKQEKFQNNAKIVHLSIVLEGNRNKNNCLVSNFEISRAFLPPVSVGEKSGKFQFVVGIGHKAVVLILICL